jgi:hypothetical protein
LEILADRKYIHKEGFRYVIGRSGEPSSKTSKNRVYILTKQEPAGWKFLADHNITFYVPFEFELQKHGVTSFEVLDLWNEPELIHTIDETATAGFLMEFEYLIQGTEDFPAHFKKIAKAIRKKNLPFVVDNYNSILRHFPDFVFEPSPGLFFIGRDDHEAGERVGSYLAQKRHKQIAYFNFRSVPWNFQRFQGVESGVKKLFPTDSKVFYFQGKALDEFVADLSTYASTAPEIKSRFLNAYSELFKGYEFHKSDPVQDVYPLLANRLARDILYKNLEPVCDEALNTKGITAWVGTAN